MIGYVTSSMLPLVGAGARSVTRRSTVGLMIACAGDPATMSTSVASTPEAHALGARLEELGLHLGPREGEVAFGPECDAEPVDEARRLDLGFELRFVSVMRKVAICFKSEPYRYRLP